MRSIDALGTYFFYGTVSSQTYLELLRDFVIPQAVTDNKISIQFGAPPQYARIARDFLDDTFYMWIGRTGTIEWPLRSPGLTPCDYSMFQLFKRLVYSRCADNTSAEVKNRPRICGPGQ